MTTRFNKGKRCQEQASIETLKKRVKELDNNTLLSEIIITSPEIKITTPNYCYHKITRKRNIQNSYWRERASRIYQFGSRERGKKNQKDPPQKKRIEKDKDCKCWIEKLLLAKRFTYFRRRVAELPHLLRLDISSGPAAGRRGGRRGGGSEESLEDGHD